MNSHNLFKLRTLIVIAMFVVAFWIIGHLPQEFPAHWNAAGEVDRYSSPVEGAFLFPGITLAIYLLFPLLAKIDPRRKNYQNFQQAWQAIQTIIVVFMAYFYGIMLYISLDPARNWMMGPFTMFGVGMIFLVTGYYMQDLKSNFFVGIRTPWTLDDDVVWDKTHKLGGRMFMLSGVFFMISAAHASLLIPAIVATLVLSVVIPVLYSFLVFRKSHK